MKLFTALFLGGIIPLTSVAACPEYISKLIRAGNFREATVSVNSDREMTAVEKDSLLSVMRRTRSDFSLPYKEGIKEINAKLPHATQKMVDGWERNHYLETKEIDGEKFFFRKAISNLFRLAPELSFEKRSDDFAQERIYIQCANDALQAKAGVDHTSDWHKANIRISIDVKANAVPAGKTIRVWLPYPVETVRQKDIKVVNASGRYILSKGSVHHSAYMEQKARKDRPTHFEIEYTFNVGAQYFSPDSILAKMQSYKKDSELYRKYTSQEVPQIKLTEGMKSLAENIVGNETNPFKQASLIYDWIDSRFPWAGAREYSTIPNLAEYVLGNGHGDCGQVSLLYITLLRSLGIPSRWESGWMLHGKQAGMHDWAMIYYEGVGWVPVDMSFGMLETSTKEYVRNFYKTGIDAYRFAINEGVGKPLSPAKKYIRSETVDFQLGEVEWEGGNLFYYKDWTPNVKLISYE